MGAFGYNHPVYRQVYSTLSASWKFLLVFSGTWFFIGQQQKSLPLSHRALGPASYTARYAVKLKSLWSPAWCVHDYQISTSWWWAFTMKRWSRSPTISCPLSTIQKPEGSLPFFGMPARLQSAGSFHAFWALHAVSPKCWNRTIPPLTPGGTFGSFGRGLIQAWIWNSNMIYF